jgi:hypothetical protein
MQDFRCYFLDNRDHIVFRADIRVDDLEAAKAHALGIMQNPVSQFSITPRGFEVWQGSTCLFRS